MIDGEEITLTPSHMEKIRMQKDEELNLSSDEEEKSVAINAANVNGSTAAHNGVKPADGVAQTMRNGILPTPFAPNQLPNGVMPNMVMPNMPNFPGMPEGFAQAMFNQMYGVPMANGQGQGAAAAALAAGQMSQAGMMGAPNGTAHELLAKKPEGHTKEEVAKEEVAKEEVAKETNGEEAVDAVSATTTTKRKAEEGDNNYDEAAAEEQSVSKKVKT
jgi:hypothetical protein